MATQRSGETPVFITGTVTSADGTTIGYRQIGSGPGLLVVHGALESSGSYRELAVALAGERTVTIPDRRGRGLSGPHGADYALASEVADIRALIARTGARTLCGVSSGAVIALTTALADDTIRRVVAYEPALDVPGHDADDFVPRYERELAEGRTADAILTVLKGAEMGPRWLRLLPRPLGRKLVGMLIAEEATQGDGDGDEIPFTTLVPTLHYDFLLAEEGSRDPARYAALEQPVLLLGGSRSPRYHKAALRMLEQLLPHHQRREFPGGDHTSAGNAASGGQPTVVAAAIAQFLQKA